MKKGLVFRVYARITSRSSIFKQRNGYSFEETALSFSFLDRWMDVFDFQCASSSFCLKLLAFLLTYFSNVCRLFGYIYFRQCHHFVESSSSFFQSFGRFHSSHFGKLEMEQINRELANLSREGKRVYLNLEIENNYRKLSMQMMRSIRLSEYALIQCFVSKR